MLLPTAWYRPVQSPADAVQQQAAKLRSLEIVLVAQGREENLSGFVGVDPGDALLRLVGDAPRQQRRSRLHRWLYLVQPGGATKPLGVDATQNRITRCTRSPAPFP